ncbi:MAG: hypothetical protein AAB332_06290 [Planctomycetota bacterium]
MTTHHPFHIRAFVLLPDHIHCIWTLPENDNNYSIFHRYVKQGDYDADWGAGRKIEFDTKVGYE